jgi:succinate dehydrogenase / fumarate reductase, cytochrome b subunit
LIRPRHYAPRFRFAGRSFQPAVIPMSTNIMVSNYFFIKRLHSLLGIIPLVLFLTEHMLVNSFSTVGSAQFNAVAGALRSMPYLVLIELAVIIVPLYFHGLLGLWITYQGSVEVRVPYMRNWLYLLQRATGLLLIIFITYHILATRVYSSLAGKHDLYVLMGDYLSNPFMFAVYVVGVSCAAFHAGNGLFNFAYKWGVTVSARAQTWAMALGLFIGLGFFAIGMGALYGFTH